jgi:hypothetical protein
MAITTSSGSTSVRCWRAGPIYLFGNALFKRVVYGFLPQSHNWPAWLALACPCTFASQPVWLHCGSVEPPQRWYGGIARGRVAAAVRAPGAAPLNPSLSASFFLVGVPAVFRGRLLAGFVHARLPVSLGGWPRRDRNDLLAEPAPERRRRAATPPHAPAPRRLPTLASPWCHCTLDHHAGAARNLRLIPHVVPVGHACRR